MKDWGKHFIERAKEKHGDKYDFSKVNYVEYYTEVIVTCHIHGEFLKTPSAILNTGGCNKCSLLQKTKDQSFTTQDFIEKASKIHDNKYDYSKVDYINNHSKILISCPVHGEFEQSPANHFVAKSGGCKKCASNKTSERCRFNTEEFITKAKEMHGDKYNYDKVQYINNSTNVIINCPLHGDFIQQPSNHLLKKGCYFCGRENIRQYNSEKAIGWSTSKWIEIAEKSKKFDSYKIYIIKCWNDTETFFKVGKTFRKINERFYNKSTSLPYEYAVLLEYNDKEGDVITNMENVIKRNNKHLKYIPSIPFRGMQECFSNIDLTEIANSLAQIRLGSSLIVNLLN